MIVQSMLEYAPLPLPFRHAKSDAAMQADTRDFLALMRNRHSVRDYSDRPVAFEVIQDCIATAATAPSGANHQPWHFVAIADATAKQCMRAAAETEERAFYAGGGGDEWIRALEPIGTNPSKPHLTQAPWLIIVFAERYGRFADGKKYKNYYVPESVGIATGFLLAALHNAGLVSLTHTPNPMAFLNALCGRPAHEKATMIIAAGHPAEHATVPAAAKLKKPLDQIMTVIA